MLTMMYLHVPITELPVKEKNALKPAQKFGVTLSGSSFLFASLSPSCCQAALSCCFSENYFDSSGGVKVTDVRFLLFLLLMRVMIPENEENAEDHALFR